MSPLIVLTILFSSSIEVQEFDLKAKEREALYLPIVSRAFVAEHLPPELGAAIARQESNWNPNATALVGGDKARGGAYGLCQVTLMTALIFDKYATPEKLLDVEYNCRLAARLCRQNWNLVQGNVEDVAAMYNSGKPLTRAPKSTRTVYVPNLRRFMGEYKERCTQYRVKSPADVSVSSHETGKKP